MPVVPPTEPAVWTRNIGLPRRAERVGQVQLGLHDALEEVGRLAEHDGVDVGPVHLGVLERPGGRLANQPAEGHVPAPALVLGLADADDRTWLMSHHSFPSRTQTRFCCRHGPDVAWPTSALGPALAGSARAASMTRIRPVAMMGLAASGPPDGLTAASGPRPSAWTSSGSSWVKAAWISATSTGDSSSPAALAAVATWRERSEVPHARIVQLATHGRSR